MKMWKPYATIAFLLHMRNNVPSSCNWISYHWILFCVLAIGFLIIKSLPYYSSWGTWVLWQWEQFRNASACYFQPEPLVCLWGKPEVCCAGVIEGYWEIMRCNWGVLRNNLNSNILIQMLNILNRCFINVLRILVRYNTNSNYYQIDIDCIQNQHRIVGRDINQHRVNIPTNIGLSIE